MDNSNLSCANNNCKISLELNYHNTSVTSDSLRDEEKLNSDNSKAIIFTDPDFNIIPPDPCVDENVKLFFGNLAPITTEDEMYKLFRKYGECYGLIILKDRKNRPRGAGFVTFSTLTEALDAIFSLNRKFILPGAHMPLEVRFPENKIQKRERIKTLKESKVKQKSATNTNLDGDSSEYSCATSPSPISSNNDQTSDHDSIWDFTISNTGLYNAPLNKLQCLTCGMGILTVKFCLDCRRGVYSH